MSKPTDEILLVRAIIKISNALHNLDEVDSYDVIPKKLIYNLNAFDRWFCENTSDFTVNMAFSDWDTYYDATYYWPEIFDESVICCNQTKKLLSLFCAKLFSALKDLLQLENQEVAVELIDRIRLTINKNIILKLKVDMKDFATVVRGVDNLFTFIIQE